MNPPTTGRSGKEGDDDLHAQVQELADNGVGRNGISDQLGISRYRVDKVAKELGITFDRSATRAATAAKVADAQAEREELAAQFRSVARVILSKVLSSSPEELNPLELKDWIFTAGSAAASDARLGKLNLDVLQARNAQQTTDDLDTVVEALSTSITQITTIPEDELLAMLDGEV